MEWYHLNNADQIDTPALIIYPDRVKYNIELVKTVIGDADRLRPHVKSHKSPDVTKLMLQAGITKFKCATIAEAEMLGMCNAPDVLLAYQPTEAKLNRFIKLINAYPETSYSCLVDNQETANRISTRTQEDGMVIPVFIDLNVGMNRTGIAPEKAFALYKICAELPGLDLRGIHAYDGHIHDADYALRQQRSNQAMAFVDELVETVTQAGYPQPVVIAGSSPTFPILKHRTDIECSPGTFIYWDKGYEELFPEQDFQTVGLVLARVISLPAIGKVCVDVGHKSVSSEAELSKRIHFLNAPSLVFTGHSEEHLVADIGAERHLKVGDILYGLPYHICPTVALYERAITIEHREATGEWMNAARDRKITI